APGVSAPDTRCAAISLRARFVLLQLGAIPVHLTGKDRQIVLNLVLLVAAAVTVWLSTVWV
ncbi:hypothetical protein, partial [Nocardia sp. NPDC004722]